jgi:hypothetical protein
LIHHLCVPDFSHIGVNASLRQLLGFGLFHGDPHLGNIFAMHDGRFPYVDFENVAVFSQQNKQILINAVVMLKGYLGMKRAFTVWVLSISWIGRILKF